MESIVAEQMEISSILFKDIAKPKLESFFGWQIKHIEGEDSELRQTLDKICKADHLASCRVTGLNYFISFRALKYLGYDTFTAREKQLPNIIKNLEHGLFPNIEIILYHNDGDPHRLTGAYFKPLVKTFEKHPNQTRNHMDSEKWSSMEKLNGIGTQFRWVNISQARNDNGLIFDWEWKKRDDGFIRAIFQKNMVWSEGPILDALKAGKFGEEQLEEYKKTIKIQDQTFF